MMLSDELNPQVLQEAVRIAVRERVLWCGHCQRTPRNCEQCRGVHEDVLLKEARDRIQSPVRPDVDDMPTYFASECKTANQAIHDLKLSDLFKKVPWFQYRINLLATEIVRLRNTIKVVNIVKCRKCGHYATGADFNVPTGGGDYCSQCPVCYAGDDELQDIDTEADVLAELTALRSVLSQIIDDLPTKRDWLDPGMEREARELIGRKRAQ